MNSRRKRICILGSTGSIGVNTLRVIEDHPEQFEVVGLAASMSVERLAEQAARFRPGHLCLTGERPIETPPGTTLFRGADGLSALVEASEPDILVVATVGRTGLKPTLRAIELGVTVALANKEVLVMAGEHVMRAARERGVAILPIDSEHNAIFQCVDWRGNAPLRRVILTASGGPFRGYTRERLAEVTVEAALAHPTWEMGRKITIDSATLMNKGFEVIEVHHLFGVPAEKIQVIVHPQSVIHSMVEYHDGSMLAQMGVTDMYFPIANVLAYPERLENRRFEPLDLARIGTFTLEEPDLEAFPCLGYAYEALKAGGTYPAALNAANEVAVERFLKREIRFLDIPRLIEAALRQHRPAARPSLEEIDDADAWARRWCAEEIVTTRA